MREQNVHMQQHYLPAARAPMKSDMVIRMGIVIIGRCRGVSGCVGPDVRGSAAGSSLFFV